MRVRSFKKTDAKACVEIINKNKRDMGDLYTEKSLVEASTHNKYWVAEEEGKVVGIMGFSDLNNGIGMVAAFCVDPAFQGRGIGKSLLRFIKNYAKKKRFRKVLALTHAKNKKMMVLSIKEDFVPEGSLRKHFRTGEDVIYLSYFVE